MSKFTFAHDVDAYVKGVNAILPLTISTTNDGNQANGNDIDRNSFGQLFQSCKLVVPVNTVLAATETLTVIGNMQDGDTTAAYTDYDLADGTTGFSKVFGTTDSTAAQTIKDVVEVAVDLQAARRFIRCQITPTFSGSTDAGGIAGVFVMAGSVELPAA